jgi:hypothetical protein
MPRTYDDDVILFIGAHASLLSYVTPNTAISHQTRETTCPLISPSTLLGNSDYHWHPDFPQIARQLLVHTPGLSGARGILYLMPTWHLVVD